MRKSLIILALCLLLPLVLCACDMQGLVGELQDAQTENNAAQMGGILGALEIIGTDENGNYIVKGENGTVVLEGDEFHAFQGEVNGSYAVIIGGNGSFDYNISVVDPMAEIDAYEASAFTPAKGESNYVKITVRDYGEIVIRLHTGSAPETVQNFKKLVGQGFYNGLVFHRVIQNFMIQGGGYNQLGDQLEADAIKGEFEGNGFKNNLKHVRGVISMARANDPDSASSQFFICDTDNPHLDGQYAAFGYVVAGMEVVDLIAAVKTKAGDVPETPVVIESAEFVIPTK